MKSLILIPLTLLTLASSMPAVAEDHMHMNMDAHAAAAQSHEGRGTVNSVDAKAGKLNMTHEAIASLDWPGMTMDFEVQDKAILANVKPGQKVKFKLIEPRHGKYVISEISAIK